MTRDSFADLPSLELVQQLIENRRKIEQARKGGSKWFRGVRLVLGQKADASGLQHEIADLKAESCQINGVLRRHYQGIIGEMFLRGSGNVSVNQLAVTQFCGAVFLSFPRQITTLPDSSRFSVVLWKLVDGQMNAQFGDGGCTAAASLKPKFMLRQFIDDLPNNEARGVLRSLAYISGEDPSDEVVIERRALLRDAYPHLHNVLWRRRKELARRTDDTISVTRKRPDPADLAKYEHWLFLTRNL